MEMSDEQKITEEEFEEALDVLERGWVKLLDGRITRNVIRDYVAQQHISGIREGWEATGESDPDHRGRARWNTLDEFLASRKGEG